MEQNKNCYIFNCVFFYKKEICPNVYTRTHAYRSIIEILVPLVLLFQNGGFMRERDIEQKFVAEVKKNGGFALKFVSPGFDGMPDRLVLMPNKMMAFVEVKAKGKKPRPLQLSRHELLRSFGFRVFVLDDMECIQKIIQEIGGVSIGT